MVRSLSLSLSLSLSSTETDANKGFSRGRNSLEFYAREDEEEKRSRVIFGFALRAFANFFSLSIALKFEDFIYTARASSALA